MLATANTEKTQVWFWNSGLGVLEKNAGEWTKKVEIKSRKKSLTVGEACMAIYLNYSRI